MEKELRIRSVAKLKDRLGDLSFVLRPSSLEETSRLRAESTMHIVFDDKGRVKHYGVKSVRLELHVTGSRLI